jgi:predicted acylesterase/phospholipase RssA
LGFIVDKIIQVAALKLNMPIHRAHSLLAMLAIVMLTGCTALPRNPVPVEDMHRAEVPGMPPVRARAGHLDPDFQADLVLSVKQEPPGAFPLDASGYPVYHALALSGGGSSGAFGAGILNGWTDSGTRPDFKVVTGISTGALIAPFAFLGPAFDEQLKAVYTTVQTRDILERLNIMRILFEGEAFARTTPLEQMIETHFDENFLAAVARAHSLGRRLYVGTTHMDAQTLVVWNMGAIASSGDPDALQLFRKIVLASSSIPAAFPPVFIEVEVDGQRFDEMHADGGTVTQVFFYEGTVDLAAAARSAGHIDRDGYRGTLHIIRNGKLGPEPEQVRRRLPEISGRALSTMIKFAAINDLYRIYLNTTTARLGYRYVAIPDEFEFQADEEFDPREMARLFELGYRLGLEGSAWEETPPYHRQEQ